MNLHTQPSLTALISISSVEEEVMAVVIGLVVATEAVIGMVTMVAGAMAQELLASASA
jgi:hypothetical protein